MLRRRLSATLSAATSPAPAPAALLPAPANELHGHPHHLQHPAAPGARQPGQSSSCGAAGVHSEGSNTTLVIPVLKSPPQLPFHP